VTPASLIASAASWDDRRTTVHRCHDRSVAVAPACFGRPESHVRRAPTRARAVALRARCRDVGQRRESSPRRALQSSIGAHSAARLAGARFVGWPRKIPLPGRWPRAVRVVAIVWPPAAGPGPGSQPPRYWTAWSASALSAFESPVHQPQCPVFVRGAGCRCASIATAEGC